MPCEHEFSHRLFMVYLDLAELNRVFEGRWLWSASAAAPAWFRRADYFGDPQVPLDEAVRTRVERELGKRPTGPIRMLTHLRYFGVSFNPVTFYYCFDSTDRQLESIVAEITNTPWGERHSYVLDARQAKECDGLRHFHLRKTFHVSPFMEMDMSYDWCCSEPGAAVRIKMSNTRGDQRVFDATLDLARREINGRSLAHALLRFPLVSMQVLALIYWHALRLWLKRVPFQPHPRAGGRARSSRRELVP